jgi:hypothetical protein
VSCLDTCAAPSPGGVGPQGPVRRPTGGTFFLTRSPKLSRLQAKLLRAPSGGRDSAARDNKALYRRTGIAADSTKICGSVADKPGRDLLPSGRGSVCSASAPRPPGRIRCWSSTSWTSSPKCGARKT